MARYEYDKKDNWLRNLLIASGQTSQPSGRGRSRPTYGLPPIGSSIHDTRRQQRDKARYQASINRMEDRPMGLPALPTNEKERAAQASVLAEALAAFGDESSLSGANEWDHLYSREMIDEAGAVPLTRPVRKYDVPEYNRTPPLEARGQSQERDEWGHRESDYEDDPSIWKKAWADWDRKKQSEMEYNRKMQQEGNFMHISGDEFPTVEESMEAREPGPLENAIIQSLASKKRKKK